MEMLIGEVVGTIGEVQRMLHVHAQGAAGEIPDGAGRIVLEPGLEGGVFPCVRHQLAELGVIQMLLFLHRGSPCARKSD